MYTQIKVIRSEEYLAHHGVQGQKWGEQNGPPYPLDAQGKKALRAQRREERHEKYMEKFREKETAKSDKYFDKKINKNIKISQKLISKTATTKNPQQLKKLIRKINGNEVERILNLASKKSSREYLSKISYDEVKKEKIARMISIMTPVALAGVTFATMKLAPMQAMFIPMTAMEISTINAIGRNAESHNWSKLTEKQIADSYVESKIWLDELDRKILNNSPAVTEILKKRAE